MSAPERDIINHILLSLQENQRLFRINAGMGWAGNAIRKDNFVIIKNPRPLHAAPPGWPDLCGWTSVKITPDMVGQTVAIFTAVEIKATGKLSKNQEMFKKIIEKMGGIFEVFLKK